MKTTPTASPPSVAKQTLSTAALLVALVVIAYLRAMPHSMVLDYFAIDGDWQNFDPVQRLASGQRLGRDFDVFLGWGTTFVLKIFSSFGPVTFASTRWASHFLSETFFALFAAGMLVLCRVRIAVALLIGTLTMGVVSSTDFLLWLHELPSKPCVLMYALGGNVEPGVSLRIFRPALPVLVACILLGVHNLLLCRRNSPAFLGAATAVAVTAGLSAIWVGDYGLPTAAFACSAGALLLSGYFAEPQTPIWLCAVRACGWFLALGLGAAVTVWAATACLSGSLSGISLWNSYARHTSADAFWYYESVKQKALMPWDLRPAAILPFGSVLGAAALGVGLIRRSPHFFLVGSVLALHAMVGTLLLLLAGTAPHYLHGLYLSVGFAAVGFGIAFLQARRSGDQSKTPTAVGFTKNRLIPLIAICSVIGVAAWAGFDVARMKRRINENPAAENTVPPPLPKNRLDLHQSSWAGPYVHAPELGGYLSVAYLPDLRAARAIKKELAANRPPFYSTYSGIFEALLGYTNPTRTDYIIHSFGPDGLIRNLNSFQGFTPAVACTLNPDYTYWEAWLRAQHWHLYRYILDNYEVADVSPSWLIWKRRAAPVPFRAAWSECTVTSTSENEATLHLPQAPPGQAGWIGEIEINYEANSKGRGYFYFNEDPARASTGLPPGNVTRFLPVFGRADQPATIQFQGIPANKAKFKVISARARWLGPKGKHGLPEKP